MVARAALVISVMTYRYFEERALLDALGGIRSGDTLHRHKNGVDI